MAKSRGGCRCKRGKNGRTYCFKRTGKQGIVACKKPKRRAKK